MPGETFFDPHQRATVQAAMARMIATDDTPGVTEPPAIPRLSGLRLRRVRSRGRRGTRQDPRFADGHRAAVLTAAAIDSAKINSWVEAPV
jgi:hypothetical protein